MNTTSQRKPTGIIVHVPDTTPVCQLATEYYQKKEKRTRQFKTSRWGYVQTGNGLFVLENDGVGPSAPVTPQRKLGLRLYQARPDHRKRLHRMVPLGEHWLVWLDDSHVRALPVLEKVDLAVFMRKGGRRLEFNFAEWAEALDKAGPLKSSSAQKAPKANWSGVLIEKGSDGLSVRHVQAMLAARGK